MPRPGGAISARTQDGVCAAVASSPWRDRAQRLLRGRRYHGPEVPAKRRG